MSKSHNPAEDNNMSFVTLAVDETCVVTLSRPSSNPDKPIRREWLAMPNDVIRLSVSPTSPLSITVLPFERVPESFRCNYEDK